VLETWLSLTNLGKVAELKAESRSLVDTVVCGQT